MKTLLILTSLFIFDSINCQNLEIGSSVKSSIFFGNKFKCNISIDLSVQKNIVINSQISINPLIDIKFAVYKNYLGSSVLKSYQNIFDGTLAFSGGFYTSSTSRSKVLENISVFSPNFSNSLISSSKYNIGIASTYILQFGVGKSKRFKTQRIGNIFGSAAGFYINYRNDGAFPLKYLGDEEDRFWTGGGTIGYIYNNNNKPQLFELSFDKFTGFQKNLFEINSLLFIDNVVYNDANFVETSYTSGQLGFKYVSISDHIGMGVNLWNSTFDFQDFLHKNVSNNPYHYKIEKPYIDFEIINVVRL